FQHSPATAAFSPLPAYDGIGGSPSYYCENAQVGRHPQRKSAGSRSRMSTRNSRQAEGDDGQESSNIKPTIRAIREEFEENEDAIEDQQTHFDKGRERGGSEMDSFSLYDSTGEAPTLPVVTPRVLEFVGRSDSNPAGPDRVQQPSASSSEDPYDPMYLMMQLFDLTVENRPQLLSDGPPLTLALSVLDRTPELSIGNFASMKKKRHIGNDFVHIVFKECDEDYDLQTLSGQFNDVHIVIQPLNDHQYRTEVHVKPGIPPFGPLYGNQIVPSSIISGSVRLTCLNANLACQVFHQDLVGFALNCEERLKQIKQLGIRLAIADEWKLDD
ncbi:hypothetical protein PHYSODRAFT_445280, partial [Phytophthora sojae]